MNGDNPPNVFGIDKFKVDYYPYSANYTKPYQSLTYALIPIKNRAQVIANCANNNGQVCISLVLDNNYELPNDYPLKF